ncbi:MAG: TonB-dependent receptor [Bacteroidales bacterium]|nr:TonB-dependent receptor [Bacteroidales bacterium]
MSVSLRVSSQFNTLVACFVKGLMLSLWLVLGGIAYAQGVVRGVLYDATDGEAIPFANVVLEGTTHGAATDINGFFLINQVPQGDYRLLVRYVGYEEYSDSVHVSHGATLKLSLHLHRSATQLHTVNITDSRVEERRLNTQVSVEKITASQIAQMPAIGGTSDLAQYLQVLPGVSSSGDQGGQLHIRGGSMIQNLCLLDGMVVYNPFHSIGLYSIFETDVILNADIYTGGFGAEYGGRLSSVMDITTRDGNKYRHSGKLSINTFGAGAILEGPLMRESANSKTTLTYLLSAKNSFLSKTSTVFYPYIDDGLPFDFLDLYGKLTLNMGNGSKFSIFGFNFDDSVSRYQSLADYRWRNYGLGGNFTLVTGSSAVLDGVLAYSDYQINLVDASDFEKHSAVNGFNMGFNITNFFGSNSLKCGVNMEGYTTDYLFYNAYGYKSDQQEHTNAISLYGTYKYLSGSWILEPGLRYIYYNALSEGSFEPRLAVKYAASDRLRFKMAGGLYSQILLDARSDNDIVNLFSGFLTSVHLSKPSTFRGDDATSCVQRAQHLVLGAEYDITNHLTTNIEIYLKNFSTLFNANRNRIYDRNDAAYQTGGIYEQPFYYLTDFIVEEGLAYGLDMSLCYDIERLYLWATYSFARVTRSDELLTYAPHYDRRHTVNLLVTYALGQSRQWELSGRWTFGSGFPYTQTQGIYELWTPSAIGDDYASSNGHMGVLYAALNEGRLPTYHRLDLGLKRKISIATRSMLEISAGITNVYNRDNLFYFDRITLGRINQLPFLATLGLKFSF